MDKKFFKYPSLVNHYVVPKKKWINSKLDELYYATEKIHWSNISFQLYKGDENIYIFSRNQEITNEDKGLGKYIKEVNIFSEVSRIKENIFKDYKEVLKISIFGELYGYQIQNMKYKENLDKTKYFRVFEVFLHLDNEIKVLGLEELRKYIPLNYLVPVFYEKVSLRELLYKELPNSSSLGGEDIEGLVYKPYNSYILYEDVLGNHLYPVVKHKTENFAEVKRGQPKSVPLTNREIKLKLSLENYITGQRIENILSKGDIELSRKNMGKLIQLLGEDIKKEFLFENEEYSLEEVEKIIKNKRFNSMVAHTILEKFE